MRNAWNWYSKESVQKALVEVGKHREVVSVFKDGSFGKRPDIIQYPADILQSVTSGTIAFHGSVERWNQPMQLDVGMMKKDLDNLREGWDVIFDPDVKDFEIAKIVTKKIIESFRDHGARNYSVKFSGGKGFHIGISFESLPKKINFQPTAALYPELLQKLTNYIKFYMEGGLREDLLALDNPENIAKRIEKPLNSIVDNDKLNPFKVVSMDVFSSRHLFRLPYSLHESTLMVSLPLKPENIDKFQKEWALPEKAKVEEKFLPPSTKTDAELLLVEALDWTSKHKEELHDELPKTRQFKKIKFVPETYFPPCIKKILEGMADGKKRSVFILINFLRNMGWTSEQVEKRLLEWNEKNYPQLRSNYLRSQLRWHFRQGERVLAPPNCDNENFYKMMGLHDLCRDLHSVGIKNPISYPIRMMERARKPIAKKKSR